MKIRGHFTPILYVFAGISLFFFCVNNPNTSTEKFPVLILSTEHGIVCHEGAHYCTAADTLYLELCSVDENYQFRNWYIESGKEWVIIENPVDDTTMVTGIRGPVTIKALFEPKRFDLTIAAPGSGGQVAPVPAVITCPYDSIVTITATPDTGLMVDHWTGIAGNNETVTVTVKRDTTVGVHFGHISVPDSVLCVWQGATGLENGSDWVNAYDNISTAINELVSNPAKKEVWLAKGEYSHRINLGLNLKTGSKIYGGFSGFESILTERDWVNNQVIIWK